MCFILLVRLIYSAYPYCCLGRVTYDNAKHDWMPYMAGWQNTKHLYVGRGNNPEMYTPKRTPKAILVDSDIAKPNQGNSDLAKKCPRARQRSEDRSDAQAQRRRSLKGHAGTKHNFSPGDRE